MDAIIMAILKGDDEALKSQLLAIGDAATLNRAYRVQAKVERVCALGEMMTPLALAAGWGKAKCVALLLEARATPDASRGDGNQEHWKTIPLHWAVESDQLDCAVQLLDAPGGPATIDKKLRGGLTPLGTAVIQGHTSFARLLIERGCSINEARDSGASPLYGACQEGHLELVKLLLSAQANVHQIRTASGATPLFCAAGNGYARVVEVLLAARADPTPVAKDGETALSMAKRLRLKNGNASNAVVALLEAHARRGGGASGPADAEAVVVDVSDQRRPAATENHTEHHPISPQEIVTLVRAGQTRRLTELLSRPAVAAILDTPAGVAGDASRIGGRTPLVAACMMKTGFNLSTVRLLLDAKASVDQKAKDEDELFPLMAGIHHAPCVKLLLERKADVAQTDGAGYSPLLAACEWGVDDVTRMLLEHGADPDVQAPDAPGYTPLVAAAIAGRHQSVDALLHVGVDPKSPKCCKRGPTAGAPVQVPREGLDALGWATALHNYTRLSQPPNRPGSDFERTIGYLGAFDAFFGTAVELGVLSASELSALEARVVDAPPRERQQLRADLLSEYRERVDAVRRQQARADMELMADQRHTFESDPKAVAGEALRPTGTAPVCGGRARIHGLSKAPALNGEVGSIVSFNADGKRRFGLRLKNGKALSILPANLVAEDQKGYPLCKAATSTEVCEALRAAFASTCNADIAVVDWTPRAADAEIDPAHMHEMGLFSHLLHDRAGGACGRGKTVYYVQRTASTESYFLTVRELMEALDGPTASMAGAACTMPWILYLGLPMDGRFANVLTPNARDDFTAEVAYITRLCSNALASDLKCPVCLESMLCIDNPSQLPCAHLICVGCLKKLYPIKQIGCKCPVCQRDHAKYTLVECKEAPGGVALAEVGR